jgi:hypothetical protein
MAARAGKTMHRHEAPRSVETRVPPPSWRQRLRARLRSRSAEDGVFRPVRLPLWVDLAISATMVAVVSGAFVGFFVWLARTQ